MTHANLEKPVPEATPETRPYWDGCAAGELRLQACTQCGAFAFPPTIACQACRSDKLEWRRAAGRGELITFTTVRRAMGAFAADAPFVLAIVRLEEGPQLMTRIVGSENGALRAGLPVEVEFETRGDVRLPIFRPI